MVFRAGIRRRLIENIELLVGAGLRHTPRNRLQFEGFCLTPMVENAYKEARGEPIAQGGGS